MAAKDWTETPSGDADMAEHERTYKWFVRGVFLFAGQALLVLMVLGYALSGDMR
jgi:hypothetical protein